MRKLRLKAGHRVSKTKYSDRNPCQKTTTLASLNKTTTLELKIKNLWKAVRYSIILYYVYNSLTVHELVTVSNLHNNVNNKNRCIGCKSLCRWIQTGENDKFD